MAETELKTGTVHAGDFSGGLRRRTTFEDKR